MKKGIPEISALAQIAMTPRWIVVSKPVGWLTIPGRDEKSPVLSAWLEERHGKLWTVHRIDRETSGVVVFARTAEAHREASLWFQKHEVKKSYDFLSLGNPGRPVFRVNHPVEGAPSVTQFEVKERMGGCFLGKAVPITGRRHQIRQHLSKEGFPILGDVLYQGPRELEAPALVVPRVALHAARLQFPSGEVFEAPWPADFSAWVTALREGAANA